MCDAPDSHPVRKPMNHTPPFCVDAADAWYFITICAAGHRPWSVGSRVPRDRRDFDSIAQMILSAARWYHEHGKWRLSLFLVMPDHVHAIVHFPPASGRAVSPLTAAIGVGRAVSPLTAAIGAHGTARPTGMAKTIADWKHFLNRTATLSFQRDFFDMRLRDDEHYAEKWRYIVRNPVTRGLVASPREWPHVIAFNRETGDELPHR